MTNTKSQPATRRRGRLSCLLIATCVGAFAFWLSTLWQMPVWTVKIPVSDAYCILHRPVEYAADKTLSRGIVSPEAYPHYARWFVIASRASDFNAPMKFWFADAEAKELVGPWKTLSRNHYRGFLPDGRYATIRSPQSNTRWGEMRVELFDPEQKTSSGHAIRCWPRDHTEREIRISGDLTTLLIASSGTNQALAVDVIDIATGEKINRLNFPTRFGTMGSLKHSPAWCWCVSRDGSKLAMAPSWKMKERITPPGVEIYDTKTGQQLEHFNDIGTNRSDDNEKSRKNANPLCVIGLAFSPDDRDLMYLVNRRFQMKWKSLKGFESFKAVEAEVLAEERKFIFNLEDRRLVTEDRFWSFQQIRENAGLLGRMRFSDFPPWYLLDGNFGAWKKALEYDGKTRLQKPSKQVESISGMPGSDWVTWPQEDQDMFANMSFVFDGSLVPDANGFVVRRNAVKPEAGSLLERVYLGLGFPTGLEQQILFYDSTAAEFREVKSKRRLDQAKSPAGRSATSPEFGVPVAQPNRFGFLVYGSNPTLEVWKTPPRKWVTRLVKLLPLLLLLVAYIRLRSPGRA